MSEAYDYDLFVIGAGSGGVRAARMAAARGVRVAIAEDRYLGGTCVNVGCVPKKLYVYAAHYGAAFEEARGYGWDARALSFDWNRLRDNKSQEIRRLNGIYRKLLDTSGARLMEGRARLAGPHRVEVDGHVYSAERILIATGGWPSVPDIPGRELALTSNEIFDLETFPRRMLVVGGGYIAVEFAGIFAGLGAQTTQLYRGDLFLRGFDLEVREHLATEMRKKDVDLRFNTNVTALARNGDGSIRAELTDGSSLDVDTVLYATGRHPNTQALGLEEAGVTLNAKGAIEVDEHFQSSVPSVYALGDVIDRLALTPVALAEGMRLVAHLYGDGDREVDYERVPTAVFSQPNIGTLGLSEADALERYPDLDVFRTEFGALKQSLGGGKERTLMKMLVDADSQQVVGLHMVGDDAGEIMQGLAVAVRAGATKAIFDTTLGIHPTSAEEFVTLREPSRRYRQGVLENA